ncbi:MAG: glycosyltransferase [Marinifilaceae bacterium]|jgi:glycosyltransferase involved in cell wall biosynthesis|nr:glycosyltransferase [Marinifilaceae bacterium]
MSEKREFPIISVIVNCYNGQEYLEESIASLLRQSYKNIEVIFWDNASTDRSVDIVKSFNDSRIRIYENKTNVTLGEARNLAIKHIKGLYLCFLDVDDFWDESKIESQYKNMLTTKSIVSYSNGFYVKKKLLTDVKFSQNSIISPMPEGKVFNHLIKQNFINWQSVMFDVNKMGDDLYFSSEYSFSEDYEILLRASLRGEFSYIDKPITYYRIHDNSITQTKYNLRVKETIQIYNQFKQYQDSSNKKYFKYLALNIDYQKIQMDLNRRKYLNVFYRAVKIIMAKPGIILTFLKRKKI